MTHVIPLRPAPLYSWRHMTTPPRVFVPFFIGSLLLTLTWGATLGMINLARLTAEGVYPETF